MHLDLTHFSTSELHYWRGTFLRICDDFAAQAFPDWDDEGFRIVHDLHTVLLDEIDRRSTDGEPRPSLPCETIRILED